MCGYMWVWMRACVCVRVFVCGLVWIRVLVRVWVHVWIRVWVPVCACVCGHMSVLLLACVCGACVYVCMCACVVSFEGACVCVFVRGVTTAYEQLSVWYASWNEDGEQLD